MCCETHVIDVSGRLAVLRHSDRTVPEAEIVHSVRALRNCEEGFAVGGLHTYHEDVLSVPLDGTAVHCGVNAETLHKVWVGFRVEVVTPEKRSVLSCQYRVSVTFVNSVAFNRLVLSCNEGFVLSLQPLQTFFEVHFSIF